MPSQDDAIKQMLTEPLDSVMTVRLSVSSRQALREIAASCGTTEQDLIRRLVAVLATGYQDLKSQISVGVSSFDQLLARSTRLTVSQFINMSPSELRRAADEFGRAAYAWARLIEGQQDATGTGG